MKKVFLILGLALIAFVLFVPLPYYQGCLTCPLSTEKTGPISCPKPGWNLGTPLIFKFLAPFFPKQQPSSEESAVTKSEKIPAEISEEEKCQNNADCGVNICECQSLNKKYFDPEGKICQRYCPGEPVCYKGRCIFKGEEDKYRLQIGP